MIALSYSRLKDFKLCPRRFFERHVARSFRETDTEAQSAGIRDHEALQKHITSGGREPLPEHLEPARLLVQSLLDHCQRIEAELSLAVTTTWEPCAWDDWDRVYFRARLDVVGWLPQQQALVLDWKTGKPRPETEQLELAAALLAAQEPELKTIHAGYVWLQAHRVSMLTIQREAITQIRTYWDQQAQAVQQSAERGQWSPRPGVHCNWCQVPASRCEFRRAYNDSRRKN